MEDFRAIPGVMEGLREGLRGLPESVMPPVIPVLEEAPPPEQLALF
jgi:hypothetical protein